MESPSFTKLRNAYILSYVTVQTVGPKSCSSSAKEVSLSSVEQIGFALWRQSLQGMLSLSSDNILLILSWTVHPSKYLSRRLNKAVTAVQGSSSPSSRILTCLARSIS